MNDLVEFANPECLGRDTGAGLLLSSGLPAGLVVPVGAVSAGVGSAVLAGLPVLPGDTGLADGSASGSPGVVLVTAPGVVAVASVAAVWRASSAMGDRIGWLKPLDRSAIWFKTCAP